MNIFLSLWTLGSCLLLLSFFMEQTHRWKDSDIKYDTVNFCGAVLLVVYAYSGDAYPFLVLNSVWAIISLRDIIKYFKK